MNGNPKKYELTQEQILVQGRTLYRIRALTSFGDVTAGALGGWIEQEENLSQQGNAWIFGHAKAYGGAVVDSDAILCGNAEVSGSAMVYGSAKISGNARILEQARISGNARVYGEAVVCGNAVVAGNGKIFGHAQVSGDARILDDAEVYSNAQVLDQAKVSEQAQVFGDAVVYGNTVLCRQAQIGAPGDFLLLGGMGCGAQFLTFFRDAKEGIAVHGMGFVGSVEEFLKWAPEHSEASGGNPAAYQAAAELAKAQILRNMLDLPAGQTLPQTAATPNCQNHFYNIYFIRNYLGKN